MMRSKVTIYSKFFNTKQKRFLIQKHDKGKCYLIKHCTHLSLVKNGSKYWVKKTFLRLAKYIDFWYHRSRVGSRRKSKVGREEVVAEERRRLQRSP